MTGHSVWSHDAHVVMEDISSLKLMSMGLLQTSRYITQQMRADVVIDVNKFLGAFSIRTDEGNLRPPSWTRCEDDEDSAIILPVPLSPLSNTPTDTFNMADYSKCRQAEAIRWINLQEKRASIIPRMQPVSAAAYQELRDAVFESEPQQRKDKNKAGK